MRGFEAGRDYEDWEDHIDGFGERLKKLIKDSGKTQKQVADDLGVTRQQIGKWANPGPRGLGNMYAFTVYKLAIYFDVSTDYLLFGKRVKSNRRPLPPVHTAYKTLERKTHAGPDKT